MKCLDLREKVLIFLIILILFLALSGFLVEKKAAFAQMQGLEQTAKIAFNSDNLETRPEVIIGKIIEIILSIMGIVLVVLMIAGGFMWMASAGNPEQVTKAKELMTSAFIGLIIVILSYSISHFVINRLSTVTEQAPIEVPSE